MIVVTTNLFLAQAVFFVKQKETRSCEERATKQRSTGYALAE
jgi:hypothetical protein